MPKNVINRPFFGEMSDPTSMAPAELMSVDAPFIERSNQELPARPIFHGVGLPAAHQPGGEGREFQDFWKMQLDAVAAMRPEDLRNHCLPLARIKKIMKSDEDVRMISAEAPVLFSKACEIFILELTRRAWVQSEANKRRTLQRSDIASAITAADVFDFLVDIVPRDGSDRGGMVDSGGMETEPPQPTGLFPAAVVPHYSFQGAHGRHGMGLDPQILPPIYPHQFQHCPTTVLPLNPSNTPSDCASGTDFGKNGNGALHRGE